jgi:hypothetical protein
MILFKNLTLIILVIIFGFVAGYMTCSRKNTKELYSLQERHHITKTAIETSYKNQIRKLYNQIRTLEDSVQNNNIVSVVEVKKPSGESIKKVKIDRTVHKIVKKQLVVQTVKEDKKIEKVAENKENVVAHVSQTYEKTHAYGSFLTLGLLADKSSLINPSLDKFHGLIKVDVLGPFSILAEARLSSEFYKTLQIGVAVSL